MKNKRIVILCLVIALLLCSVSLVSCNGNNEDEITITVIDKLSYSVNIDSVRTQYEIKLKKGEKFNWSIYRMCLKDDGIDLGGFGAPIRIGFYEDDNCLKKFDEDVALYEDRTLYVDSRYWQGAYANYCHITFIYENAEYDIFRDFSDVLNSDSFAVSAYGKSIDVDNLEFYWDEGCTQAFDIDHSAVIISLKDHWESCPGELTFYVKTVETN